MENKNEPGAQLVPNKANFVYFIGCEYTGPVKVGVASDPESRLASLQIGCPYELKLLGTVLCRDRAEALRLESVLHEEMASINVRGEWFAGRIGRRIARRVVVEARRLRG